MSKSAKQVKQHHEVRRKKESETNLDADMHINLRSGNQASQHNQKTKQHEPPSEENHVMLKMEKTSQC